MKNPQGKIRKLKIAIGKGEFGGSVVDQSKPQQEIDAKSIDWLASFERKKVLTKFMS